MATRGAKRLRARTGNAFPYALTSTSSFPGAALDAKRLSKAPLVRVCAAGCDDQFTRNGDGQQAGTRTRAAQAIKSVQLTAKPSASTAALTCACVRVTRAE